MFAVMSHLKKKREELGRSYSEAADGARIIKADIQSFEKMNPPRKKFIRYLLWLKKAGRMGAREFVEFLEKLAGEEK